MNFDLSKVEFNNFDLKRQVKIPESTSKELAEEIGIHIGDGSLYSKGNRSEFRVFGNPKNEVEYFKNFLQPLYNNLFNIKTWIRIQNNALCIPIYSKAIVTFKKNVLGLPAGEKARKIEIPDFILKDNELFKSCLRGIFDTDGCLLFDESQKRAVIDIHITSNSVIRAIRKKSVQLGFHPHKVGQRYAVRFQRRQDFHLWFKLIGSNNPKTLGKYYNIINRPL
jgi:intein/homing endonuclease